MKGDIIWVTVLLMSLQYTVTLCLSVERYEIVIFQKAETQLSSLSCLVCFNGDATNDCLTLKNISSIPARTCMKNEPYCKVRRLSKDDNLVTFDRYCASHCVPGCREGARYTECVSCCNHESLCNVDNSSQSCQWRDKWLPVILLIVLTHLFAKS